MIHLTLADLLVIAERVTGQPPLVRDVGLLESAAARPQASAFGEDAYPTLEHKAAALTHSVVNNHALVDGNKRLGLGALIAMLGMNGRRLTLNNDEAYELIMDIATNVLGEVDDIAKRIRDGSEARDGR